MNKGRKKVVRAIERACRKCGIEHVNIEEGDIGEGDPEDMVFGLNLYMDYKGWKIFADVIYHELFPTVLVPKTSKKKNLIL